MTVRMDDEFECSVADYWDQVFLTEEYQERLHIEGLGYSSYQGLEHREEADALVHRSIEVTGVPGLPRFLQKLFPSGGYVENGVLNRNLNRWSFTIEPRGVAGRVHVQGEVQLTEAGPNRCRRTGEIEVQVRPARSDDGGGQKRVLALWQPSTASACSSLALPA